MPTTYNVSMGQAVSVRDLGEDALVTGITSVNNNFDPARALLSCSAVALVNTRTRAAGLFHFPSGDIVESNDPEVVRSRETLVAMAREIRPNQLHFGHGQGIATAGYAAYGMMNQNLAQENANLRLFVRAMAPDARENVHRATAGAFLISRGGRDGEQFEVDLQPDDGDMDRLVDLSEVRAGGYSGYQVYGLTVSAQAAEDRRTMHRFEEIRRSGRSSPASRGQSEATRSGASSPASTRQSEAARSGAGSTAPREQFEVADPIPNVPPRHRRRWLQRAIRRMTCRGD